MIHKLICEGCHKAVDDLYATTSYTVSNKMVCAECIDYEEQLMAEKDQARILWKDYVQMSEEFLKRWSD